MCSLLVIAFLLGRLSTPPAVTAGVSATSAAAVMSPAPVVATPPEAAAAAMPTSPAPFDASREITAPAQDSPRTAVSAPSFQNTPAQIPPATQASAQSPERQQVAAYFAAVDRVGDMGSGDPQAFANSLMQSVSSGDFSGFDDLLAKSRAQRDQLRALTPPKACSEHHRLALSLSNDSVSMMERLKTALMKGDATSLMTMATEGQTLEAQATRLKAMSDVIKRQVGL